MSKEFRTFKELPQYRVYPRNVLCTINPGDPLTCNTIYDIFIKWDKKTQEQYTDVAFKEDDMYWPIGTLNEQGILKARDFDDKPYFGKNIKNAVRYIFLKTQKIKNNE